jgi:hypothetical protein
MLKSEQLSNLAAALAKAQAQFPAIPRSKVVKVTGPKGSYEFAYAPFEEIIRSTRPVLAANGLAFSQGCMGDKLVTTVLHSSGEWIAHETPIVNVQGTAQSLGSALTYSKRYGFCGAFGIQADDDDDANAADGNTVTEAKQKNGGSYNAKKDAFEAMPPDEQEFLRKIAANVSALISEDRAYDAYGYWRAQNLDADEMVAIQHLWDSKERSALTKAAEQWKIENGGKQARANHKGATPTQREAA